MEEKKVSKKLIIIGIAAAVVIITGAVIAFLFMHKKKDDYRLLKIYEFSGEGIVERKEVGSITPYSNMVLESGDKVTLTNGSLTILADDDKYIYLDEGTVIELVASGTKKDSRTKIELENGGITCDVQNKLSDESTYEINTPNASMSIRGTIVYVFYDPNDEKGKTRAVTFEGVMDSVLIYEDGSREVTVVPVPAGQEVIITRDTETTYYFQKPKPIDYNSLPERILRLIQKKNDTGRDTSITNPEIEVILNGPYTVTFEYNKKVFATQSVKKGEKAVRPTLNPAASGDWNYNFNEPVTKDITVEWK